MINHAAEAQQLVTALDIPHGPNMGDSDAPYGHANDLPGWHRVGQHRPAVDGVYPDHGDREYRAPSGTVYTVHAHDPQRPQKVAAHIRVVVAADQLGELVDVCYAAPAVGADLHDYTTGDVIRPATAEELAASETAAESDGGAGVIEVDGRSVYAQ
jgi:hypothetical protein